MTSWLPFPALSLFFYQCSYHSPSLYFHPFSVRFYCLSVRSIFFSSMSKSFSAGIWIKTKRSLLQISWATLIKSFNRLPAAFCSTVLDNNSQSRSKTSHNINTRRFIYSPISHFQTGVSCGQSPWKAIERAPQVLSCVKYNHTLSVASHRRMQSEARLRVRPTHFYSTGSTVKKASSSFSRKPTYIRGFILLLSPDYLGI